MSYQQPNPAETRFDLIPYSDLNPEHEWTRLGRGSFGCVYKGEYLGLAVAIKEVLESNEYDVEKYFQRECRIMQECRHPNIVQYIGLSLAPPPPPPHLPPLPFENAPSNVSSRLPSRQKRILIISEFLPNGNLRSYIANRRLDMPWSLRMSFAVDTARAVAYLHARRCLHRDLKGENLLVAENGRIKVCDFGFARLAARNEEEMRRMSYCGTDGYMSPEILQGLEFGLETDIFSLGVIFCEILSRRLVDSDTFKRLLPSFTLDPSEVHSLASPGCPPGLIDLALACTASDPSERPPIRTILDHLRHIERDVIAAEKAQTGGRGYHVGSMSFGRKGVTGGLRRGADGKGKGERPGMPGRIPSFGGSVRVPGSITSESSSFVSRDGNHGHGEEDGTPSSTASDEDVNSALDAIGNVEIEERGRSAVQKMMEAEGGDGELKGQHTKLDSSDEGADDTDDDDDDDTTTAGTVIKSTVFIEHDQPHHTSSTTSSRATATATATVTARDASGSESGERLLDSRQPSESSTINLIDLKSNRPSRIVSGKGSASRVAVNGSDYSTSVVRLAKGSQLLSFDSDSADASEAAPDADQEIELEHGMARDADGNSSVMTVRPTPIANATEPGAGVGVGVGTVSRVGSVISTKSRISSLIGGRPRPGAVSPGSSLPSIPSGWKISAAAAAAAGDGDGEKEEEKADGGEAEAAAAATNPPSKIGSIASFRTAYTNTPSIAAATIGGKKDESDLDAGTALAPSSSSSSSPTGSARSSPASSKSNLSTSTSDDAKPKASSVPPAPKRAPPQPPAYTAVEPETIDESEEELPIEALILTSLHRFSINRPGWRSFYQSAASAGGYGPSPTPSPILAQERERSASPSPATGPGPAENGSASGSPTGNGNGGGEKEKSKRLSSGQFKNVKSQVGKPASRRSSDANEQAQTASGTGNGNGNGREASPPPPGSYAMANGGVAFLNVLTKCSWCDKRLGLMRPYMSCDDCGYLCHVKCAEGVPGNCPSGIGAANLPPPPPLLTSRLIDPAAAFAKAAAANREAAAIQAANPSLANVSSAGTGSKRSSMPSLGSLGLGGGGKEKKENEKERKKERKKDKRKSSGGIGF